MGFHLDSRYNNGWDLYPGFVPYGPWSMAYGFTPYTWVIKGITYEGGHGPWNKDWANFSMYPLMDEWPGHERWNSNIHAPMSSENTVHQNAVYVLLTYGYVNARHNINASANIPVTVLSLNKDTVALTSPGQVDTLVADMDVDNATFGALTWTSGDKRIAHVDGQGRITGVTAGSTTVTCSTLDGSITASCAVTCSWPEVNVDSIWIVPDTLNLVEGQNAILEVFFSPEDATNKFVDWSYSADSIVEVDDIGLLTALQPGIVYATATSLNSGKKDSVYVEVSEALDHMIADFDHVIPVLAAIDNDSAQLYTPEGANNIFADNPLIGISNSSLKVVQYDRPEGEWRLIGMVLPTDSMQDLSRYSQFQFKYFGEGISEFWVVLVPEEGEDYAEYVSVESEECWKGVALDLEVDFTLKQFNVFVNPRGLPDALTCYFDDFLLAGKPAEWYGDLTISDSQLDMDSGDEVTLVAEAEGRLFTWVSTDPAVVTVNQEGLVKAISAGTAEIRAVPLYGEARECEVTVDGGGSTGPGEFQADTILDFEGYELDWSAGYGGYSWASAVYGKVANPAPDTINSSAWVVSWDRDGTNAWGGLGIVFPSVATKGWERISMQVYSLTSFNSIRIELLVGDSLVSAVQTTVNVPAGEWTGLIFDLADMDATDIAFDKIHFIYGGGTTASFTVFTDNVWLEKGENATASESIRLVENPAGQLLIYPNPVRGSFIVSAGSPVAKVEIFNMAGETVFIKQGNEQNELIMEGIQPGAGFYIIRVTDNKNRAYFGRLLFQ